MFPSRRPALGARAVSDMAPLTPTPNDPLAGTRVSVGGRNVVAGSQLSKGGRAPESPFLPLPPAPNAEELQRMISEAESASTPRSNAPCSSAQAVNLRSSMMVRSYSMPVPTEKEFALQRSMHTMQRQSQSAWANGWTPMSGSITEARRESAPSFGTMERTSSKASTSMAMASTPPSSPRKRRSSSGAQPQRQSSYKAAAAASRSPPSSRSSSPLLQAQASHSPRQSYNSRHNQENCPPPSSPYAQAALLPHLEDEQESYFSYRKPGSDNDDMSDDEALTPRAGSPMMLFTQRQSKDVDMSYDDIFAGIHPDHLAPPRAMLSV